MDANRRSQRGIHCWQKQIQPRGSASAQGTRKDHPSGSRPNKASSRVFRLPRWTRTAVRAIKGFGVRLGIRRYQTGSENPSQISHSRDVAAGGSSADQDPTLVGRPDQSHQNQTPQIIMIESDSGTNSAGALAKEHVLCPACRQSATVFDLLQDPVRGSRSEPFRNYKDVHVLEITSSQKGCHLCSLFLGKIRHLSQTTGPIVVTLDVSRSGGVTLQIKSGEAEPKQRLGELVVVPATDVEEHGVSVPADTKFTFPTHRAFKDAQIAKSISSDASFTLAREWLQQCLQRHSKCSQAALSAQTGIYPSRLIDVEDGVNPRPRVVLTQEWNEDDLKTLKYLTLSHCWGGADILRLLIENVDKLTIDIPMHALPRTFQDAMIITRRLGYRYIWIDSLCIIQDSPDDWRACSAVMGEIYANSTCTVAALTARNSYEGCFFDNARNPLFFRPCRLSDGWYVEGNPSVGVDLRVGLSTLPLHTRAWVVQERILAPRTLCYGSNGLAWECTECSATEAVPWGQVSRFSPKASFFDIQRQSHDAIYDCWTDIQISYTRCNLTRFSDRLVAISGVIKRIQTCTGWKNVWGLWREHLLRELLWFVEEPTQRPVTEQYLAPTWSWVGIEGRVMMAIGSAEKRTWMAEVVDVGSTEGRRHVRIKGMMKRVRYTHEGRLSPLPETTTPRWEEVDWDADVKLAAGDFTKELQCLLIARLPEYIEDKGLDIGLVMSRQGDEWMRVGVFRELREGNNLFPESMTNLREVAII